MLSGSELPRTSDISELVHLSKMKGDKFNVYLSSLSTSRSTSISSVHNNNYQPFPSAPISSSDKSFDVTFTLCSFYRFVPEEERY